MSKSATTERHPIEELPRDRFPEHIAVIMDGNGRWAQRQGLPRIEGHRRGVSSVRRTVEECARLKIRQLTLYCLSSENWKRPQHELDFLMHLLEQYMIEERSTIMNHNVRVQIIGRRDGIPEQVQREMDKTIEMSAANTGSTLCLAINYGGRAEMVDAVRCIAEAVKSGSMATEDITEETITEHLYTRGMPDPDLMIRTAGEMRISNFLLWQISYSELWVTDLCWPEFREETLRDAIHDFASRDRRFGGLNSDATSGEAKSVDAKSGDGPAGGDACSSGD
ncbi:di-trans,poly-cis-decaprenylcistransferase [Blastopirellula marina]|uniref:Isoprenyl transferase n=1 Tax=Blastopirellula marina TaxID=124 RepID=A0A2S8GRR8_9BACT|nr:di-trans,poly-cis-decaprenylcistransferase [Blastopirellula marina]